MTVNCPHCGQQTVLNAAAGGPEAPAAAPPPSAPATPAPAQPAQAKPVARPVATAAPQAKPVAGKPLTEAQKAAIAAARAANPIARPPASQAGAKPAAKKSMVVKTQWADGADDPDAKPVRCDFCGTKVPAGVAQCPDCGTAVKIPVKVDEKPNWVRRIGFSLVLVLALVAAWRWGEYYLSIRPKKGADGKPAPEGIAVLSQKVEKQPGTALQYVRGMITNHSDVPYFDVKVECELLDKNGVSLGKFVDTKMVVDAHKLIPFSISMLDPDAVRYTNLTVSAQR
jgi:hypothetical protein